VLLAIGVWTAVLGYTVLAYGAHLAAGPPVSMAYLIGTSDTP